MLAKKIFTGLFAVLISANIAFGSVVRDAETEALFEELNRPIVKAMGEKMENITFRLVLKDEWNAHVSGGKNVYFMSGLILGVDNAQQFLAVSAHELGHIKENHLTHLEGAISSANKIGVTAMALGVLGGLASKNPDTGFAAVMLGNQAANRGLTANIRANEVSADLAALDFFEKAKMNPIGQVEINKKMLAKSGYSTQSQIYQRTHPASEDRLRMAQDGWNKSPYKNKTYSPEKEKRFKRVQAKLLGYVRLKKEVFGRYPLTDTSDNARYSRAMFYLANNKASFGVSEMKKLIEKYPDDGYYLDSYATVLFSNGQTEKAIEIAKRALKILPMAGSIWLEYARYNIAKGTPQSLREAEYALFRSKRTEGNELGLYHLFTSLYSKTKEEGKRLLSRAEFFYLQGEFGLALSLAEQALSKLPKKSAEFYRTQDIIEYTSKNIGS